MKQTVVRHKIALFYLLAFAISWPAWFLMSVVYRRGDPIVLILQEGDQIGLIALVFSAVGGLGPLISLSILEKLSKKEIDVEAIVSGIKIRDAGKRWLVPAIFAFPAVTVLGNLVYFWLGREGQLRFINAGPDSLRIWVLPVMVIHFTASLLTSPLFEEPGWRGFALVDLQKRFGREAGSMIVGVLWWIWHQPMNLTFGVQPTIYAFLSMIAFSFMIDSLFNLSGKNLFIAMLAHQSAGTVFIFLYEGQENIFALALLIGFVILLRLQEWKRAHNLAPKARL